jgi:hypothetical protein
MHPQKDPNPPAATVLNLPVFESRPLDHFPGKMTWEQVMDETEPMRQYYMKHFDSPEKRLRNKNPEPFRMHPPGDRAP